MILDTGPLHDALAGRLLAACFGAGVDSTAMLIALKLAGLRPDLITFADPGAEKPSTLDHIARMDRVLSDWGWPRIVVCRKKTLPGTAYSDLYGNCIANETRIYSGGIRRLSSVAARVSGCPPLPSDGLADSLSG